MEPGDWLVLCTDGIIDARDAQDQPFGQARLREIVHQFRERSAEELVNEVARQVNAHFVGDSPADDLTILAIRRLK
jgi:serine phosphatase RsbU (regulator of sigma subunit)